MDTKALVQLIQRSPLLSEPEREYWLKNLPSLNSTQSQKLWNILNVPDELPFQKELEQYFASLGRAAEAALGMQKAA